MSTHEHAGPGYASPDVARQQEPEKLIYVASPYEGTGIDNPDFVAIVDVDVDVDPSSSSHGQIVGRTDMAGSSRRRRGRASALHARRHHHDLDARNQFYPDLKGWITKLDRRSEGTHALDEDFFVDFAEQTDGARPHGIHLPGGDCTTEIFQ